MTLAHFFSTKFLCIYESLHILFWWSSAVDLIFFYLIFFWGRISHHGDQKKIPLPKRVIRKNKFQILPYFEGKKKKESEVAIFRQWAGFLKDSTFQFFTSKGNWKLYVSVYVHPHCQSRYVEIRQGIRGRSLKELRGFVLALSRASGSLVFFLSPPHLRRVCASSPLSLLFLYPSPLLHSLLLFPTMPFSSK